MPWLIRKRGEEWCVYKEGADGEPVGDALGCHPTEVEAEAQRRALEANVQEMLREYVVGEFRGDFPEVPTDPRVDITALTARDENPFFLTLPIARLGETSANGLDYDEELVKAIEEQAVGKGGILGHLRDEDRETAFPIEDVDWVGVKRVGNTTWGKAYVPPGEAREFVRRLKARGGQLATSIYGPYAKREALPGGRWRAVGLRLEQIDLAPADRAALKLGGRFAVTAQMGGGPDHGAPEDTEDDMATREEILAGLTAADVPQVIREQIITEHRETNDQQARVAELEGQIQDRDAIIAELRKSVEGYQLAEFETTLNGVVAEFVKLEPKDDAGKAKVKALTGLFRSRLVAEIGEERDAGKIKEIAQTLWKEELEPIAETIRDALAGPAAVVGGRVLTGAQKLEDTPENRRKARAKVGI